MGYIGRAIDEQFKTTEDGRKLFFPWKWFWPWKSYRGYILCSDKEYERLRRGESLWLKVGQPSALLAAFLIHNVTESATGSFWMGFVMFFVSFIPFAVSHLLWLHTQCRGMKVTKEKY
ncbi:MAG: hypothetical protein AB1664_13530 [Thermodesulfobacteriota bacterium]